MKKLFVSIVICLMATVSCFAQYNTSYYNQYGGNNNYNYWFELPKDENQDNVWKEKTYKF